MKVDTKKEISPSDKSTQRSLHYIKDVVMDLIRKEKRETAFQLIEFYFKRAKTIEDYDILGELSLKAEHRDLYLKCAEYAYAMANSPKQLFIGRVNLHKAYLTLNYPEKALHYAKINNIIDPKDFDSKVGIAFSMSLMNNKEHGEKIIQDLMAEAQTEEDKKNVEFALSGKQLREGKTKEGILNFIDKFKEPSEVFHDILKMKKWEGGAYPGKILYVNGEGGIGDEIINIRFFDHIKNLGMRPVLYSSWNMYRPDTVDLFRRHGHEVISETYSINRTQLWTHMMSIPGYLGCEEKDLWSGPYLKALRQPKNELTSKKFKIGIKCSGNPYFSQDQYRCIPIESMLESLPIDHENVEIYYLDKEKNHPKCINMNDKLNTWEDTLDYIDQMDLIVSSCTSLIHAAGAIGKRSIVVVPIAEYYVWTSSRTDGTTPWYGNNLKILRQTKVRSWKEPLDELKIIVNDIVEQIKE